MPNVGDTKDDIEMKLRELQDMVSKEKDDKKLVEIKKEIDTYMQALEKMTREGSDTYQE